MPFFISMEFCSILSILLRVFESSLPFAWKLLSFSLASLLLNVRNQTIRSLRCQDPHPLESATAEVDLEGPASYRNCLPCFPFKSTTFSSLSLGIFYFLNSLFMYTMSVSIYPIHLKPNCIMTGSSLGYISNSK